MRRHFLLVCCGPQGLQWVGLSCMCVIIVLCAVAVVTVFYQTKGRFQHELIITPRTHLGISLSLSQLVNLLSICLSQAHHTHLLFITGHIFFDYLVRALSADQM